MPELTLEQVMTDLQVKVKNKKLELETLGKEINSLLDEKLSLVNSINSTRQKLAEFSDEKKKLEVENRTVKIFIKDQRDEFNKDTADLDFQREDFDEEKALWETDKKKEQASIKSRQESLARDRQTAKETEQKAKDEAKKSQELQVLLNAELVKTEKLQREYEAKAKESKTKQDEASANLEKSKEIKAALDEKIAETDKLKDQYENLIKANETKTITLEKQLKENEEIKQNLLSKNESLVKREIAIGNRQAELDDREKQLNIKELRFQKLLRDKNMTEELAKLEAELGIKK